MDTGTEADQEIAGGNRLIGAENIKGPCRKKPGRSKKEPAPEINLADGLPVVLEHFLPDLPELFRKLPEPRDPQRLYFSKELLLMQALLMALTQASSRRQFGRDCANGNYSRNLASLLGLDIPELASADAVNYLLTKISPEEMVEILPELARHLIRSRALDCFRLDSCFLLAFDGTEILRQTNIPHCENCLTAKHSDGRTDYFHQVVDAKLVTEPGLTLSLGFEFIENDGRDYVKQDCELKAFNRLAETIKRRFPRLSICALGDALYACEKVIDRLTEYNWSFFISFLPERIPTLYKEAEIKLAANPKNRLVIRDGKTKETCTYSWVDNLKYRGKIIHAVYVDIAGDNGKTMRLAYLTDFRPDRNNIVELVNKGGRQRAKIENCFNIQKNHGYNLEHVYGAIGHALKNFYTIIQIAHLIHQLMLYSDLFRKLAGTSCKKSFSSAIKVYETIRHFTATLAEALRHKTFSDIASLRNFASRIQLRFVFGNSS